MRRTFALVLLLFGVFLAYGQAEKPLTIDFGQDGSWGVWQRSKSDPEKLTLTEVTGTKYSLVPPTDSIVGVWNKETGLAAEKPASDVLKSGTWKLAEGDYTRIYEATVLVSHDLKPAASGIVTLTAGKEVRTAFLSPADKGKVSIKNLPLGPISAEVKYKVEGAEKTSAKQSVTPGKKGPVSIAINIPDAIDTVAAESAPGGSGSSSTGGSTTSEPAKPVQAPGQSPIALLVNFLIGAIIVGGIGYGIYHYFKKDPKQAHELLKKAGLDPDGQNQTADPAPIPAPVQKPLNKIILNDAAPVAISSSAPVAMAAPTAVTAAPRLVMDGDPVFDIPEGPSSVGRESTAGLQLDGQLGVSRSHATIRRDGSAVYVSDLGSTNGTYVNGVKITEETLLKPGDVVIFGAAKGRFES